MSAVAKWLAFVLVTSSAIAQTVDLRTSVNTNFVIAGDSLSSADYIAPGSDWPAQALQLPWFKAHGALHNEAFPSRVIADLTGYNDDFYRGFLYPYRPLAPVTTAYLFVLIGTNNIQAGETGADTFNELSAFCTRAKSDGFTVIVFTIPPVRDWKGTSLEANRADYNDRIRNNRFADRIIDADRLFSLRNDPAMMYYDGKHISAFGGGVLAQFVNDTMNGSRPFLATPARPVRPPRS